MKKMVIIILSCLVLNACKPGAPISTYSLGLSLIYDGTDTFFLTPSATDVLALYNLAGNAKEPAYFRYTTISDLVLNSSRIYHLPADSVTERLNTRGDMHFRDKVVQSFYDSVKQCVVAIPSFGGGSRPSSQCFRTILSEVTTVADLPVTYRVALVYSDLQEFSTLYDCYKNRHTVLTSPETVANHIEAQVGLPATFKKTDLVFLYQPENSSQEEAFLAMVEVYRLIFEKRGITIHVLSDNTNLNTILSYNKH
jgi:hypothetical protein